MAERFQAPRGTRDLLPEETGRWQWAEARARDVLERYGYREIRTPLFEDYQLFARTSGESSDVVQKEMYRFQDLKGRDLALRPEGTAPVCRAYLEHGLAGQGRIHRLWYHGPMFRYGRPQKGRYRQFWQFGAEVIGTDAPGADVEIIALFVDIFEAWGFEDLVIRLNSVGTPVSRAEYAERLREWLQPIQHRLSDDSKRRLSTNPFRILDSKDPTDRAVLEEQRQSGMPLLAECLDAKSSAHFESVLRGLKILGINEQLDPSLVRGLDYYTHTTFEVHDPSLGAQSALGGGGRYDGLIEELGGPPTPAVGFSIGLDRVLLVLGERGEPALGAAPRIAVVAADEEMRNAALLMTRVLRKRFTVEFEFGDRSLSGQLRSAARAGAKLAVIYSKDHWSSKSVAIRNLNKQEQVVVAHEQLEQVLSSLLASLSA